MHLLLGYQSAKLASGTRVELDRDVIEGTHSQYAICYSKQRSWILGEEDDDHNPEMHSDDAASRTLVEKSEASSTFGDADQSTEREAPLLPYSFNT